MFKALLLLLNFAKLGPLLKTGGTMMLSVFAYAWIFGWRYAVGFVLLIFVHELGHYLAAKRAGLNVGAPTFIPFVGAWIELKDQPMDARMEAKIALAGPVAGTFGALLCYYAARNSGSLLLLALSYSGFMINLWNLLPINPLDGGRIVGILSPRIWLLGAPILGVLLITRPSPMLFLLLILALPSIWSVWRGTWHQHLPANYYEQPLEVKLQYGAAYLGLAIFLAMMSSGVHEQMGTLRD
ncbi:MAG: site-2 protease family protein [Xanthomonadales bacterium]|nr:site-2 protease family protein [Xanthomonadales bacterium]